MCQHAYICNLHPEWQACLPSGGQLCWSQVAEKGKLGVADWHLGAVMMLGGPLQVPVVCRRADLCLMKPLSPPHPFSITPSLLRGEQRGNELHRLEFQKALQLYGDSRALSKSPPGSTKKRWTTCKRCGSLHPASEQESSCFQSEDALF